MGSDLERAFGKRSGTTRRPEDSGESSIVGATALLEEAPARVSGDLDGKPEWQLALRIAASKGLSKSDLLPRFLLFICERTLTGNSHEISEQRIGTQIFNRPLDYNPGEDNIVRSYARLLRKRLDEYFLQQGSHEPLRIEIPRGGYVPVFGPSTTSSVAETPFENFGNEQVEDEQEPQRQKADQLLQRGGSRTSATLRVMAFPDCRHADGRNAGIGSLDRVQND